MMRAYRVHCRGASSVFYAHSAGKARYQALLDIREAWPEVTFADLRVESAGVDQRADRQFGRVCKMRGVPSWRIGQRVRVGEYGGVLVGADDSANFVVLLDEGRRVHAHVGDIEVRR